MAQGLTVSTSAELEMVIPKVNWKIKLEAQASILSSMILLLQHGANCIKYTPTLFFKMKRTMQKQRGGLYILPENQKGVTIPWRN